MPGCITGITFGNRVFNMDGNIWLMDAEHKLVADIHVNPFPGMFTKKNTPMDYMDGYIYKVSDKEVEKYHRETYAKYMGPKGVGEKVATISGRWT